MPVPSPRNSIRIARGNYADLAANATEIGEGELCFAIDQDKFYSKAGNSLVAVGGGTELHSIAQLGDVDITGAANGQVLGWNGSTWVPVNQTGGGGGGAVDSVNGQTGDVVLVVSDLTNDAGYITAAEAPVQISDIPTNNNQLLNGAGYITAAEAPVQPDDIFSGDYNDLTNKPTIPPAYDDTALDNRVSANESDIAQLQTDLGNIDTFSGDYNDLSNKPSIPSSLDDLDDVDTSSAGHVPADGQALVWDEAMGHWMPGTVSGGGGGGAVDSVNGQTGDVSLELSNLTDVKNKPSVVQPVWDQPGSEGIGSVNGGSLPAGNGEWTYYSSNAEIRIYPIPTSGPTPDWENEWVNGSSGTIWVAINGGAYQALSFSDTQYYSSGARAWYGFNVSNPGLSSGDSINFSLVDPGAPYAYDGDSLVWNNANARWEPQPAQAASLQAVTDAGNTTTNTIKINDNWFEGYRTSGASQALALKYDGGTGLAILADGTHWLGGDVDGINPNITLNASGSAEFASGNVTISDGGSASFAGTVNSSEQTITGTWDLSAGNFWTCGAITVPNPTNATAGTSGLIRLTAAPTGWGANIKHPGGSAETISSFPAMVPFYVQDDSTILLGKATQGIA